eukprot:m.298781 g.298781  ORF g.298781 m.298781 type:complete len:86 (+) comp20099_c0_seq6:507-764(+)
MNTQTVDRPRLSRGELVDFEPRLGWQCKGYKVVEDADAGNDDTEDADTGTTFTDVDLTEKEWYDYDDKGDFPVQITDIEITFERV